MRDDAAAMGYPSLGGMAVRTQASHTSRAVESAGTTGAAALSASVLGRLCLPDDALRKAGEEALRHRTDLGRELVCAKLVTEDALARAMADVLGLAVSPISDAEIAIEPAGGVKLPSVLRTCSGRMDAKVYVAPRIEDLGALERILASNPAARDRIRLTTPRDIRRRRARDTSAERAAAARLSLSADRPEQSARQVVSGAQGAVLASLAIVTALLAYHALFALLIAVHILSAVLFLAPTGLRLAAALAPAKRIVPPGPDPRRDAAPASHPTYSVLVALRQEEEVVGHLVKALSALRWPRSKLEVFLICEADDPGTIAAATAAAAGEPGFEIVVVPVSRPRTKPKALNFALPLATGEFVVLYDAEDRPDPGQLEAAWKVFRSADDRLACLQAELTVANGRESRLSSLFALEYAALFGAVLPWLAAHGLPLPLGGTSNHFRRRHLVAVGGWDSHNVTEDADLGIRLGRHGYRVGTLASATLEDAPTKFGVWHDQRTRWMKGWMQTYLVHMRDPAALLRDLGIKGFLTFQILFTGMVVSAIAHPLFLFLVGKALGNLAGGGPANLWIETLLVVDLLNVLGGTMAVVLLARATIRGPDRPLLLRRLVWLYPYWLLVSLSAARAVVELCRRPHHWAKTPHGRPFVPDDGIRTMEGADMPPHGTAIAGFPGSAPRSALFPLGAGRSP